MCSTCFGENMSRRKPEVPSLADALAKGFAELNSESDPTPSAEQTPEVLEVSESVDMEPPSKPQYGRPSQHKGQENSFIVNASEPTQDTNESDEVPEQIDSSATIILEKPSTSLGDDFDVEW